MWPQGWHHFFDNAESRIKVIGTGPQTLRDALLYYWRGSPPQKKTSQEKRSAVEAYCENIGFSGEIRRR